jgi:hypothetical protein
VIGSAQTSKAVGSLVDATGNAINEGNNSTVSAQQQVVGAGQTANSTLAPYTNLGAQSANTLAGALAPGGTLASNFSFDPTQIANNPDYKFQLQQGIDAVQRAGAATGTLNSSGTQKGILNYAGGLASSEIGQAYQQALGTFQTNYGNRLNSLTTGTNLGLGAQTSANANTIGTASQAAQFGVNNANNIEELLLKQGQAKASGSIAQGNIWAPYAGQASNSLALAAGLG